MTVLAFASLFALALPQQTFPTVAPLDAERLFASLQSVPATNAERVTRLVELFKGAGAEAGQVEVVPLGASLMIKAEQRCAELRLRLTKAGAPAPEIETAVAALNRRLQALDGNVVAKRPGRNGRVLLVAAHLDASPGSAGIVDDWAGCALLAELFAACRDAPFQHELWFVAFAKQEDGCLGSAAFADSLTPSQCDAIDAVVSVDCAGVSAPYVWWSGSDRGLVELASDAATAAGQKLAVLDFPGGISDGLLLKGKNLPVVTLLGVDPARFRMLHGPADRVEAVDRGHLKEMGNLLARLLPMCDPTAQPLRWEYVGEKLRIGDGPGKRNALQPVQVDLAAAVAPPPAPAVPSSPRDGSHRP